MLEDTILATKKMDKYAQIEPFDPAEHGSEDFSDQFNMAFALNGLKGSDAAMKKGVLLTLYGKKTFRLLKSLCTLNRPNEKSFDELCA